MKDKNGNNILPENLISIKRYGKTQFYYVVNCDEDGDIFNGYRVNKNFSINAHDKKKEVSRIYSYMPEDEINLIDPMPPAFLEALRTLHFWVENVIEELGVIIKHKYVKELLRPVRFENGSYGVVRNEILPNDSLERLCHNGYEDLTYDELIEKWSKLKTLDGYEWKQEFDIDSMV